MRWGKMKKITRLPIKSRDMVPEEFRLFLLGQKIYDRWKINGGVTAVLIQGGKVSLAAQNLNKINKTTP
jgi:hypothetical protein